MKKIILILFVIGLGLCIYPALDGYCWGCGGSCDSDMECKLMCECSGASGGWAGSCVSK